MSETDLPRLWCIETKNKVKENSPIVHDGSTHYYQDFACAAFSEEEACSQLGPYLDTLGLTLEEVIQCRIYDSRDYLEYSRRRSRMMASAQQCVAFSLLNRNQNLGKPDIAWGASSKAYESTRKDGGKTVWAICVKVNFPIAHPANFDASEFAHEKYFVPAETLDDALQSLQVSLDKYKQTILELLYAEVHDEYKCYPFYPDDFSSLSSEYLTALDLKRPVGCGGISSEAMSMDEQ